MSLSLLLALAVIAAAAEPQEPAQLDYKIVEADFRLFEQGLKEVEAVTKRLFPRGLDRVDAALYDTSDIYVYTRDGVHPYPLVRESGGWKVYKAPHRRRPSQKEMSRCAAGVGTVPEPLWTSMPRRWFACSAWGAFKRIQYDRDSEYQYEEGYLSTVAHELGHLYYLNRFDDEPVMRALGKRLDAMTLDDGVDPKRAKGEAFATWAEGMAARELYPKHWRRMKEAAERRRPDDWSGHEAALKVAVAHIEAVAP